MLTRRMSQLLMFLQARSATGVGPTFNEMREALGLKSKSGVHRLLKALAERGYIRRIPGRVRAVELIRHPDACDPSIARIPVARGAPVGGSAASPLVSVPHYGRLAPGLGIEALAVPVGKITVSCGTLPPVGECFAMDVRGDSMIEAGILDDDTIIVVRADRAEHADVVLAAIDDEEIVLRRLLKKGGAIALAAANVRYETRIFGHYRVSIVGRVCGLIRRYPDYRAEAAAIR